MTKQEKALYKNERKSKLSFSLQKSGKIKLFAVLLLVIASIVITVLELCGITSWYQVHSALGINNGVKPSNSDFAVYYLDVGQSDCTIVVSNGSVMVIDSGSYTRYNHIAKSLHSLDITKIDYLVITHPHSDHFGGAEQLLDNFTVCNIIMPCMTIENNVENEEYLRLLNAVAQNGVNAFSAQETKSFDLSGANVDLLAPLKQYKDLNNMSIVLRVTYGETSFLFQGDAESQVENDLLNSGVSLKSTVLKVGHHGSKTSSTNAYLKAVEPQLAIISCGEENTYGHPRVTVIEYLAQNNIDFLITASYGDIVVESDGKEITVVPKSE